jgi:hypothetical protein
MLVLGRGRRLERYGLAAVAALLLLFESVKSEILVRDIEELRGDAG